MKQVEVQGASVSCGGYLEERSRAMQSLKQQDYFRPCAFAGFPGVVFPGTYLTIILRCIEMC